jgi:hypothetical protein
VKVHSKEYPLHDQARRDEHAKGRAYADERAKVQSHHYGNVFIVI